MTYTRVEWLHSFPNDPTHLYYELNDARMEQRKVEVWRNGRMQWADSDHKNGSTMLAWEPHPTVEQIASDPQFQAREISQTEFETIWNKAVGEFGHSRLF